MSKLTPPALQNLKRREKFFRIHDDWPQAEAELERIHMIQLRKAGHVYTSISPWYHHLFFIGALLKDFDRSRRKKEWSNKHLKRSKIKNFNAPGGCVGPQSKRMFANRLSGKG